MSDTWFSVVLLAIVFVPTLLVVISFEWPAADSRIFDFVDWLRRRS